MTHSNSKLYVVATPIGNLQDISMRAIETLKQVNFIACEDTRHSAKLLNALGIQGKLLAYHEHNESKQAQSIIEKIQNGESVALISDAGTPLISDPGKVLLKKCYESGVLVEPIPGPSALITALSALPLKTSHFLFYGFLPHKDSAAAKVVNQLKDCPYTLVLYEAPHRVERTLGLLSSIFGQHTQAAIARELTKHFESFYVDDLSALHQSVLDEEIPQKGEFVIVVEPVDQEADATDDEATLKILLEELPLKQAVKLAVKITQKSKNVLYEKALALKKGEESP